VTHDWTISKNKTNAALKEMILGALDQAGGQDYLAEQAAKNPSAFLALIGKVLPTTLAGDPNAAVHVVSRIELVPVEPDRRDGEITDPSSTAGDPA
jgi:hypothetical protein